MKIGLSEHSHDIHIYLRDDRDVRRGGDVREKESVGGTTTVEPLEVRYGSTVESIHSGSGNITGQLLAQRADGASVLLLELVTNKYKWVPVYQPKSVAGGQKQTATDLTQQKSFGQPQLALPPLRRRDTQ